jgi:GNAT superfamily N-acetyltransferase
LTRCLGDRGKQQAAGERSMTEMQPSTSVRWHVRVPVEDRWKIRAASKISKPATVRIGWRFCIFSVPAAFIRSPALRARRTKEHKRMTISVRDAKPPDAAALASLCGQLGYPTDSRVMPDRLARLVSDPNARCLVATNGDDVAGLATVHLRYTLNHEAPIAQLTLLVVDEAQRTHGVGRALVAVAEEWSRSRGAKRFVVTTALRRADAHAFYEKLEFKHTGRRYGKDFS